MNTQLLEQARHLTVDDQIELVAALWDDIAQRNISSLPTEAQKAELDRRLKDHLENPDDVIPWDEVKASVLKYIGR